MRSSQPLHFPRKVAKRILQLASQGRKNLVIVMRNGKPSSVWGFEEYLARKELTKKVRPWEGRKKKHASTDPLGAVDLGAMAPLTRENFYS